LLQFPSNLLLRDHLLLPRPRLLPLLKQLLRNLLDRLLLFNRHNRFPKPELSNKLLNRLPKDHRIYTHHLKPPITTLL
jgi:hypothetical protein